MNGVGIAVAVGTIDSLDADSSIAAEASEFGSEILDEGFNDERVGHASAPAVITPINENGTDDSAVDESMDETDGLEVDVVQEGDKRDDNIKEVSSVGDEGGVGEVISVDEHDELKDANNLEATPAADNFSENNGGDGPIPITKPDVHDIQSNNITTKSQGNEKEEVKPNQPTPKASNNTTPNLKFQYNPLEHEVEYYDALFHHSKEDKTSTILPPKDAAKFFLNSGIPSDRLRMIWNMSVLPATPYPPGTKPPPAMTRLQFQSAVRLIQLFQNRVTAKDEMLRVEEGVMLAPPYFAGVSGVVVPLPWKEVSLSDSLSNTKQQHQQNRHSTGSTIESTGENEKRQSSLVTYGAEDGYAMSQSEYETYTETFTRHCVTEVVNGSQNSEQRHVYVDEAVSLFKKSGLTRGTLGKLWDVVVTDPDSGKLNAEEFVLMTHLIVCVTRRGLGVPSELPAPLRVWRMDRTAVRRDSDYAEQQQQQQQQPDTRGQFPINAPSSGNEQQKGLGSRWLPQSKETRDEQRMKGMEQEIQSLKETVASLQTEVQELRGMIQGGGNPQVPNSDSPADDDPNVDVEMYWGQKDEDVDQRDVSERTVKSHITSFSNQVMHNGVASQPTLPSALRNNTPKGRREGNRNQVNSNVGMSRNIPQMHPSSSKNTRRLRQLHQSMPPQSGIEQTTITSVPLNDNYDEPADGRKAEMAKSMINGSPGNLASQMQQVQREEEFGRVMQRTMERMKSSESGSHASSSHRRGGRHTDHAASFKPAQLSRSTMTRRRQQPKRTEAKSFVESARHVVRRMSGETEIYHEYEPPSTAAVDLPPL